MMEFEFFSVRGVMMERWNGIGGNELSRLFTNPRYPRRPNKAVKIRNLVSPVNKGNNYGLRLRTYFVVSLSFMQLYFPPYLVKSKVNSVLLIKIDDSFVQELFNCMF